MTLYLCNAQVSSKKKINQTKEYIQETKDFIKYIRTTRFSVETILLVDKPPIDQFYTFKDWIFRDSTLFTKNEQIIIKSKIKKPLLKKWNSELVYDANFISSATINSIFKDRNKSWAYFYKHYGKNYNSFSAPIFLRNNTLCLFYTQNSCGRLCGSGQIAVFKKEGDEWILFKTICEWIN